MLWARNLQLHYPFENQANDYSGNARHGTVFGSGVYATRPNGGRCLYFDGVGDYVKTPSFALSGTVVVFAADIRCKSYTTYQLLFASVGANINAFRDTNTLYWKYVGGGGNAVSVDFFAAPYNDAWLHMVTACDYAGKKCYFYRNAVLTASPSLTGTPIFPSDNSVKLVGCYDPGYPLALTDGYLANVYLGTLPTCPPVAALTANANRLMLGMNPIWSV